MTALGTSRPGRAFDTPPDGGTHPAECGTHPAESRRHPRHRVTADLGRFRYALTRATQPAGPRTTEPGRGWGRTGGVKRNQRAQPSQARRSTDQHRAARRAATATPRAAGSIPTPTPAQRKQTRGQHRRPSGLRYALRATHPAEVGGARRLPHPAEVGARRLLTPRRWALRRRSPRRGCAPAALTPWKVGAPTRGRWAARRSGSQRAATQICQSSTTAAPGTGATGRRTARHRPEADKATAISIAAS